MATWGLDCLLSVVGWLIDLLVGWLAVWLVEGGAHPLDPKNERLHLEKQKKITKSMQKIFQKTRGSIVNTAGKPKTIVQSCFPKNAWLHREYCWKIEET